MNFMKGDYTRAQREMDCYNYCIDQSERHMQEDDYSKAAIYLENAARSARELEQMQESKRKLDEWVRIERIRAEQQMAERLIANMGLGR